jgi:hypothetical protein
MTILLSTHYTCDDRRIESVPAAVMASGLEYLYKARGSASFFQLGRSTAPHGANETAGDKRGEHLTNLVGITLGIA